MIEPQESGKPGRASAAELNATHRIGQAQAAAHRNFRGTVARVALIGAAGSLLYNMWNHSEEPLPKPVGEAVSACLCRAGAGIVRRRRAGWRPL